MDNFGEIVFARNYMIQAYPRLGNFKYHQSLIILLFVSATLIFLDLGLFSASFIFGLSLIGLSYGRYSWLMKPSGLMWFLFAFLVVALMSLIFSEIELEIKGLRVYIQTIYWFLLATIIYKAYPIIDKVKLSRYVFFAVLLLLALYVSGFRNGLTQNGVAFSVIILAPLAFYFLKKFWWKIGFASLLVFLMLLNGSRSGALISAGQSILIVLFSLPGFKKYIRLTLAFLGLILVLSASESTLGYVGNLVYPYNPRLGELMTNTEFVLRNDMSWLQRQAQIQKGKQIFAEHPILGIGYTKFPDFDILIDESQIESDRPLRNIDNRSSHNTYVAWLAETGVLGFGIMTIFFLVLLIVFWRNIDKIFGSFESSLFISLVGMLVYFYTISGHLGTSTWIMYGIIAGGVQSIRKSKNQPLYIQPNSISLV